MIITAWNNSISAISLYGKNKLMKIILLVDNSVEIIILNVLLHLYMVFKAANYKGL